MFIEGPDHPFGVQMETSNININNIGCLKEKQCPKIRNYNDQYLYQKYDPDGPVVARDYLDETTYDSL